MKAIASTHQKVGRPSLSKDIAERFGDINYVSRPPSMAFTSQHCDKQLLATKQVTFGSLRQQSVYTLKPPPAF